MSTGVTRSKIKALRPPLPSRIDELAFSAGFNSLSAFYRCFRQQTGQSPREYLKRLREEQAEA